MKYRIKEIVNELFKNDEIRSKKFENKIKKALTTISEETKAQERQFILEAQIKAVEKYKLLLEKDREEKIKEELLINRISEGVSSTVRR